LIAICALHRRHYGPAHKIPDSPFDVARVDLLVARDAHRPGKAARAQGLAELGAHAIAGVGENRSETHAGGGQTIEFGERDLRLGPRRAILNRHAGALQSSLIAGPGLRQEQSQAHHHRDLASRQRQRHQGLAIGGLAQSRSILRSDPDRMRSLLRQRRVIDDEERVRAANQPVGLIGKLPLQWSLAPHSGRHKMMELVVIPRRQPFRDRSNALAVARSNQPGDIKRKHPPSRLMSELGQKGRKPIR
jgi:hypothetical protein